MKFEEVAKGIYLLKIPFSGIWAGVYLVVGKEITLIDSGLNGEGVDEYIVPALRDMGLSVKDVTVLLNTHTHGDHIGGHRRLKELNGSLKIIAPFRGKEKLQDPLKYNILIRSRFPEDSAEPSWDLKGVMCDGVLRDGERADRLTVIETPGHDDDCVCYFDGQTGTLLTGDSLQQNGTDTQGAALYMDLEAYRDSIQKLQKRAIRKIVCGHPFHPLGAEAEGERACGEYLAFCMELTKRYDELIPAFYERYGNLRDCAVALIRSQNGIVPKHLFLALYTVSEHIKKDRG